MKRLSVLLVAAAIAAASCQKPLPPPAGVAAKQEETSPQAEPASPQKAPGPPVAKLENAVDEHWGVKVSDPYRYLENMDDAYVQSWFKGQAEYAQKVLREVPGREQLLARIKELDKNKQFQIFSIRRQKDGTLFYKKLNAGENIPKLYVKDAKTKQERLLVDPEAIPAADKKHFSMEVYKPSSDGAHVVYGLAQGGSEETTYHVIEVGSGKVLDDAIDRVETAYNTPQWSDDGQGFFYSRRQKLPEGAPATDVYKKTKVYYHRLGTSAEADILVAAMDHSARVPLGEVDFPSIYMPTGSAFAVLKIKHGDSNPLTLYAAPKKSLLQGNIPWTKICDVEQEVDDYDVSGGDIYLMTSRDAPRFKIAKTGLAKPDFAKAKAVVPQGDYVIESLAATRDALYVGIIDGGFNKIIRNAYQQTKLQVLDLPGQAAGFIVAASPEIDNPFVYTNSWTKGSKIYEYDAKKGTFADTGLMPEGKFDNVAGFASKEVKVKSHDGVMVPLSIVYPENIKLDGKNPTLVVGYGAYGMSIPVFFSAVRLAWLEKG